MLHGLQNLKNNNFILRLATATSGVRGPVWAPQYKRAVKLLEQVQWRTTKDHLGTGASLLKGLEKETGPVQPGEAWEGFSSMYLYLRIWKGLPREWSQALLAGSMCWDERQQAESDAPQVLPEYMEEFYFVSVWVLEQISQRSSRVSLMAKIQKLSGHNPKRCVLGKSYLSREFGLYGPTSGPFKPYPCCDPVILWFWRNTNESFVISLSEENFPF